MKHKQQLSASMMLAASLTVSACTKTALTPEAPKMSKIVQSLQKPTEPENASVSSKSEATEIPSVERVDEETARFTGSSKNAKVITDGKAVELASFSVASNVLVAKDDVLYQVKPAKALEIPSVEISTVENVLSLDVDVDDSAEFSVIASSVSDSESVEIDGERCLALKGDAPGTLINSNSKFCWANRNNISPKISVQSKSQGFSIVLSEKSLLEGLKKYPLLAVKVRSSSEKLVEVAAPTVSAPVLIPASSPLPTPSISTSTSTSTAVAASPSQVIEESKSVVEDVKAVTEDVKAAAETAAAPVVEVVPTVVGVEAAPAALVDEKAASTGAASQVEEPTVPALSEAQEAVTEESPVPTAPAPVPVVEAAPVPVPAPVAAAPKVIIPVIELPKDEDEIESLPVLVETYIQEAVKADDKVILEMKDPPLELKLQREIWIEKSKQRLAVYKEKKRLFNELRKERQKLRKERKKVREELAEAKREEASVCALIETKADKEKGNSKALEHANSNSSLHKSVSDKCVKAKAAVLKLEDNETEMTIKIAELKKNLEADKQESLESLKLLKEAQASLKAVNLELKLHAKK